MTELWFLGQPFAYNLYSQCMWAFNISPWWKNTLYFRDSKKNETLRMTETTIKTGNKRRPLKAVFWGLVSCVLTAHRLAVSVSSSTSFESLQRHLQLFFLNSQNTSVQQFVQKCCKNESSTYTIPVLRCYNKDRKCLQFGTVQDALYTWFGLDERLTHPDILQHPLDSSWSIQCHSGRCLSNTAKSVGWNSRW